MSDTKGDKTYKWDVLKESLKNNGYDIEKYGLINVSNLYKQYYLVMDGHHRISVLKELYGEDFEVDVEVKNLLKTYLPLIFLPIFLLIIFIFKFIHIFFKHHSGKLVKSEKTPFGIKTDRNGNEVIYKEYDFN
jgi:hypothetical protein